MEVAAEEVDSVGYSLWRGGRLLGRIDLVFPSERPGLVAGMLNPLPAYGDIEPVVQLRMDHLPGRPVLQMPGSEMRRRRPGETLALRKLSAEEAAGIEPARVFELRDDDDQPLELAMLSIERVDARENRGAVRTACEELGIDFSPWYLIGRLLTLLLGSAGISACHEQPPDRADHEVASAPASVDSAGIRVVSNPAGLAGQVSVWRVDSVPRFRIGHDGSVATFGRVAGARRRADGMLAVVDGMTHEIIVVDSLGTVVRRIGRQGAGPGEFARPPVVAWSDDGTLLAFDPGSIRISSFDLDGSLVREQSLAGLFGEVLVGNGAWRIASDGTLIGSIASGSVTEQRYRVLAVPAQGGALIDLARYDGPRGVFAAGWIVSSSFAHRPLLALGPDGQQAVLTATPGWEVRWFDLHAADLTSIARVGIARSAVEQAMIEDEQDVWRERAGDRVPAATYLDALAELEVPDSLPAIASIFMDPARNVWLGRRTTRERRPPVEYVVLDASGRWIANAIVPVGIGYITDVSSTAIVARTTSSAGDPVVSVHPIRR
jgi:6-bladed beta-propeller